MPDAATTAAPSGSQNGNTPQKGARFVSSVNGKSKTVSVRLADEQVAQVHAIALLDDVSFGEVIRRALERYAIERAAAADFDSKVVETLARQEEVLRQLETVGGKA
jgi:hypothetical protein